MDFINKLERKYGRYAIRGLMRYLAVLYAIGFCISITAPSFYLQYLSLSVPAILSGQVWRIFTYLVYPPSSNLVWGILMLWIYYMLGNVLEGVWGSFKFNCYILMGVLMQIVAAFILYFGFGVSGLLTPDSLNMTLFLAYATTFQDATFYLYFIIPVKAKFFLVVYGVYYLWLMYTYISAGAWASVVALVLSLVNYGVFLVAIGGFKNMSITSIVKKRRDFQKRVTPVQTITITRMQPRASIHRCAVCGRTEHDDENLEFRFCSKCNGEYEYCSDHLYTHRHVE